MSLSPDRNSTQIAQGAQAAAGLDLKEFVTSGVFPLENPQTDIPRIRVLRRTTDPGLSPAVIEGFLSSSSDYVGVIDADLQHDPAILPQMIVALDTGAEIAVGSRNTESGGTGTWNGARRLQSRVATKMAKVLLGVDLTDPMSGYFVLRRDDFNRIHDQLDSSGFKILLEIIARLAPSSLAEVPYTFRTRVFGQLKLSSRVVLKYLGQLWRLSSVRRYRSAKRPAIAEF